MTHVINYTGVFFNEGKFRRVTVKASNNEEAKRKMRGFLSDERGEEWSQRAVLTEFEEWRDEG